MVKQDKRIHRDPYFYWKLLNMILAAAILVLVIWILLGGKAHWMMPAAILLGIVMSVCCGMMELAKGRRFLGYTCSVFAGIMSVALLTCIIGIW